MVPGTLIAFLLLIFTLKYITCPVYTFPGGTPFSGSKIYNPYENLDPQSWHKGNFQVQSRAWAGITSGRGNSNEDIYTIYKNLGYDIIATSDYQRINRFKENDPSYVPVYEHGYSIPKTHQVLIGAKEVIWKDYPFFQTIHNKQNILNKLRQTSELTFLAHPRLRNGYLVEDMRLLSHYDGIEVLNNYRTSPVHWDAALSAGNYVTILSNDDAHDITNPNEIGHHCTLLNTADLTGESIKKALGDGNSIGVKIWRPIGETMEEKIERTKILPTLLSASVVNDTFLLQTDSLIRQVRFIGQNSDTLKISGTGYSAFYKIEKNDPYIRAEIEFTNRITFYLNPVCRYNGIAPSKMAAPQIDLYRTWLLRIIGFATLLFIVINWIYIRKKRKKQQMA
ncbi:MAG: hypothetical protein KDC05_11980 [Bacteroidales bacterium]|nr:hypothetical protein [Bacteroidales bacterium]